MELTYPWHTYPSVYSSPYYDLGTYRAESKRLLNYIKSLEGGKNTLLHLTIGAAMEEAYNNDYPIGAHWRQLFPLHIDGFDGPIEICIVSPNKEFADEKYIPCFVKKTEYEWTKKGHCYTYKNITINIFCTMFPHIDHRNKQIIDRIEKKYSKNIVSNSSDYRQSQNDIEFVTSFYKCLSRAFDKMSYVTCFSFAVFNYRSVYSRICNYVMFSEIIKLFKKKNRFLGEWVFNKNINYVIGKGIKVNYTGCFNWEHGVIKYNKIIEFKEATLLYF